MVKGSAPHVPDQTRERAKIRAVHYGEHERFGCLVCEVGFDLESGVQGMCSPALCERTGPEYARQILACFGVENFSVQRRESCDAPMQDVSRTPAAINVTLGILVGLPCWVLRNRDRYNEPIIGIEVIRGDFRRRFTHAGFARRQWPDKPHASPLAVECARVEDQIAFHQRAVRRLQDDLAGLESGWVDWGDGDAL